MSNLSKIKREKLLEFLNELKKQHDDDSSMFLINEIENELKEKKYGLIWEEHSENVEEMLIENIPIFKEIDGKKIESIKGDPYNFLLEGDNLHSLRLLEKTHTGRIDFIYIDPPYNTKNKEFVYDDTKIGIDDGYRHSKWLSFMYERLNIAWNLLSDEGIIFISIDDNEYSQLKLLCDEIFGENKLVGTHIWRKKAGGGQTDDYFVTEHEYILSYKKSDKFKWIDLEIDAEINDFKYKHEDGRNYKITKLEKWGSSAHRSDRPSMYFPIIDPDGNDFYPIAPDKQDGRWRVGVDRMNDLIDNDYIHWDKPKNSERWIPYEMTFYDPTKKRTIKSRSILYELSETGDATNMLTNIFGKKDVFNNPKPVDLIMHLLKHCKNNIVLDFFAGSGTTAQAVMELNKEDGGNRKFILCTNNENNIAKEITFERLKKIIDGYEYDGKEKKVLKKVKLTVSNLKKINDYFDEFEKIKILNKGKYEKFTHQANAGYLTLYGENTKHIKIEGIPHNLKYYKTDFIKKLNSDEIVSDKMLKNINELIELEHHIEIDNLRYIILYDEDNLSEAINRIENKGKLFVASGIFLSRKEKKILDDKEVSVIEIPEYYFRDELRDLGEI